MQSWNRASSENRSSRVLVFRFFPLGESAASSPDWQCPRLVGVPAWSSPSTFGDWAAFLDWAVSPRSPRPARPDGDQDSKGIDPHERSDPTERSPWVVIVDSIGTVSLKPRIRTVLGQYRIPGQRGPSRGDTRGASGGKGHLGARVIWGQRCRRASGDSAAERGATEFGNANRPDGVAEFLRKKKTRRCGGSLGRVQPWMVRPGEDHSCAGVIWTDAGSGGSKPGQGGGL